MGAAQRAGISLSSICGGRRTCGRCKIRVISGRVSEPRDDERERLSDEEITEGFRLACAIHISDNLTVEIPASSLDHAQRVQVIGEEAVLVPDPVISVYKMKLWKSSLHTLRNDWEYLRTEMRERFALEGLRVDPTVLRELPSVMQARESAVTVLIRDMEVISVQSAERQPLGMAFDIGTTTIAAYLVDLSTGKSLAAQGAMNPQIAHGEDVISRIRYALEGGGDELRASILQVLNRLICEMVQSPEQIAEVTVVGNTAMHHLILGLPLKQLGTAPYLPAVCDPVNIKARDLGLRTSGGAYAHFLPNIAGFVGGDHVSMLLATGLWQTDRTVIGIDIGTNTEITLAANGTLTSLSCASGPAFEGGCITHGMRATDGAIEKVEIDKGEIHLTIIGDVPPLGICGSGVVDLLSELHRLQVVGSKGGLHVHPLVRKGAHGREVVLASGDKTGTGQDIVVTQSDVGEIQLAKAAVRSGIDVLLHNGGISEEEIDEVILAGAFGQGINPKNAVEIGMFPSISPDKFRQVGNAAGVGAKLALISARQRTIAEQIAKSVRYLELMAVPQFSRQFSRALRFPNKG